MVGSCCIAGLVDAVSLSIFAVAFMPMALVVSNSFGSGR
jgi:hypothetical protein